MPSVSPESSEAPPPLTQQLIHATQALAAAQTQAEVVMAVLTPALQALKAMAGAVLLVDEEARTLQMAGHLGYDPGTLTIWQDGPLDDQVPAADVLQLGHPLYFEHAGALKAAYPDLEERTGAVTAVASTVLPMFLGGRPLGTLVLDFREPHTFTAEERYFLRTLAAQCTIAFDRAGHLEALGERLEDRGRKILEDARAHEAFVAFTEAAGSETDLLHLVKQAIEVLSVRFPGASVAYYELEENLWKARVWSDDVDPAFAAIVAAGLPAETPVFAQVLQLRQPVFTDAWDAEQQEVQSSDEYTAAALYPLTVNGEFKWLLTLGIRNTRRWSGADRTLVRAVGRGLNLALERTETARQLVLRNAELQHSNAELQARTRALDAFAKLTRDMALTTDPLLLVRRAQEVMLSLLADGTSVYYELEDERWIKRVQSGSLQSPELQAVVDAGLPYTGAQNLYIPWTTGQPYFQDVYHQDTDNIAPLVHHIAASATFPLHREGRVVGVLAIALFHQRAWSTVDRVVLETVVQSLEQALDRAAQTQTLEEERTALETFTRFTEQVGSQTDVQALVQQAIFLLEDTCGVDVLYLERKGDLFQATAWNPLFDLDLLARLQAGYPFRESEIAGTLRDQTVAFIDHWNAAEQRIEESRHLKAVAGYPHFQDGEMQSVLLMASRRSVVWTERKKRIFQAVGRSLDLALDRALQTRTVIAQRDALDARTHELAASPQELEAFSYSISHDLRTPVRHMLGFLKLAQRSLNGRLDERSARYLDVVEQAAGQMNTLIDALLNLSNAALQALRPTTVDLNELMRQLQAALLPDLLTRNVQWEVAALPSVQGDPDALKQVLTQLTENALKFTSTRDPAIIKVWAEDQGDTWKVSVQDNGLGFDPRYRDRLFNLFQRLHSPREASGSGVGLASVRRLVQKHGGQVFAEGEVDKGATFGFTLPKEQRSLVP